MKKKKFDCLGVEYLIKEVKEIKIEDKEGIFRHGETNYLNREVKIAKSAKGIPLDKRDNRLTLLHELFHLFLDEGQYSNLSDDEPLVEWLARCMNAAMEQGVLKMYE